ncbi:MAG: 2-C-methyl-D-erythritol 4-phosphate cytidylyltransferase [Cyanobacteria bacterium P01_H01_bin.119]
MHLLIPSAGMGRRMGSDRNKILLTVLGRPVVAWTLLAAEQAEKVDWIGMICQPADQADLTAIARSLALTKPLIFIEGGRTRQESVYNGLQALPADASHVLIHDGARCLATAALFNRCALALGEHRGIIAAIAVKDTIKVVDDSGMIQSTPDRSQLWAAQTPQGFDLKLLKACHDKGRQLNWQVTDDAALFEKCGLSVAIVPGEETNLKVTTPIDLTIAEFILRQRRDLG